MSMTEPGKGRLAAIKLGFIGVGSMGGAIISGLLVGGKVAPGKPDLMTRIRPGRHRWMSWGLRPPWTIPR